MRVRILGWLVVSVALGLMIGLSGCGQYADCDGGYSDSTNNPNGSPCNKRCHCSNRAYEGLCVEGRCKSRIRGACNITKDLQGCTLIIPKEGTTCLSGKQTCNPKIFQDKGWPRLWGDCEPLASLSKDENTRALCLDRINNDCDDKVDLEEDGCKKYCYRNSTRSCYTGPKGTINVGVCAAGTQHCNPNDNEWFGTCADQVLPSIEVCNGKDDDCDGDVDEDLPNCLCSKALSGKKEPCYTGPTGTSSLGVCRSGLRECKKNGEGDYRWGKCEGQGLPKKKEECNALDDNCNGLVDEGCPCQAGGERSCGNNIGECQQGTQTCLNGTWSNACAARVSPRQELCDHRDNDCNGQIDDNITRECRSACGKGSQICAQGKWLECSAEKPKKEDCDNVDNDCDGLVDEGLSNVCQTDCGPGVKLCNKGKWSACVASQAPTETCDDKDNDCDGLVDEGLSSECQTKCGPGVKLCNKGKWSDCVIAHASPEVCNGKDDNCNGKTDEGLIEYCKTACGSGVKLCKDGKMTVCSAPSPKTELCNGIDDDCNGTIDEKLTRKCTNACGTGTQTCHTAEWSKCSIQPKTEVCNGKDDDCDGATDENLIQACTTACGAGFQVCKKGNWQTCSTEPKTEMCNNIDDDCNGTIDDKLTRACKNACGSGTEVCAKGNWQKCSVGPKPEVCNNVDDDCNGTVDDKLTRTCKNACGVGTETCSKGKWGKCSSPQPKTEVCNGKDDDCDGDIDENLIQTCTSTVCPPKKGIEFCHGGKWVSCSATCF